MSDDIGLVRQFHKNGTKVETVQWDKRDVDWSKYDAVLIRTPYGYHQQPAMFKAWLNNLQRHKIPVMNDLSLMLWNIDKATYLKNLEYNGVDIIPTEVLEQRIAGAEAIIRIASAKNWSKCVLKPSISAGGNNTHLIDFSASIKIVSRKLELFLHELKPDDKILIQKFMPEIQTNGEFSLVFFGNEFSHAIQKLPTNGGFMVQGRHGGTSRIITPHTALIEAALNVINHLPSRPVYTRVDGIISADKFLLMEAECIEPHLSLSQAEQAGLPASAKFFNAFANRYKEIAIGQGESKSIIHRSKL